MCTAYNLSHHGLFDVLFAPGHHRHTHTVAVQCEHRVTLSHENRFVRPVGHERVLSVRLADKRSFEHLSLRVQTVLVVRHLLQEVVPGHFLQGVHCQHLHGMRVQMELFENLFETECLVRVLHEQCREHFGHFFLRQAFAFILSFCHTVRSLMIDFANIQNFF